MSAQVWHVTSSRLSSMGGGTVCCAWWTSATASNPSRSQDSCSTRARATRTRRFRISSASCFSAPKRWRPMGHYCMRWIIWDEHARSATCMWSGLSGGSRRQRRERAFSPSVSSRPDRSESSCAATHRVRRQRPPDLDVRALVRDGRSVAICLGVPQGPKRAWRFAAEITVCQSEGRSRDRGRCSEDGRCTESRPHLEVCGRVRHIESARAVAAYRGRREPDACEEGQACERMRNNRSSSGRGSQSERCGHLHPGLAS